jgi:hypothetical protein
VAVVISKYGHIAWALQWALHLYQALETIFVEEAFGDFNEKAFMDAACRAQSVLSVGGKRHTSRAPPPGAGTALRTVRSGWRIALGSHLP